jgi:hypothetical protein
MTGNPVSDRHDVEIQHYPTLYTAVRVIESGLECLLASYTLIHHVGSTAT